MIIFGSRGVTYGSGEGEFHCPDCGQERYKKKRVRSFFTLYFIPVIPLNLLGEYVECARCKSSYKTDVLSYDPSVAQEEHEAEYRIAVRRVMVLMCLADGHVDDEEVETIRTIYGKIANSEIDAAAVRREIDLARSDGRGASAFLQGMASSLNDHGKEMIVRASFLVAAADGEFQDEEKELMAEIGSALQMTPAHLNGVMSEMVGA